MQLRNYASRLKYAVVPLALVLALTACDWPSYNAKPSAAPPAEHIDHVIVPSIDCRHIPPDRRTDAIRSDMARIYKENEGLFVKINGVSLGYTEEGGIVNFIAYLGKPAKVESIGKDIQKLEKIVRADMCQKTLPYL